MKKLLFALPAIMLALFISGCGKNPDAELKSKVPDSADAVMLVDGSLATQTTLFQEVKVGETLDLTFKGEVKTLFERLLAESKKDKDVKNLKVAEDSKSFTFTIPGEFTVDVLCKLYNDDLMLFAGGKTDPKFFQGGNNKLFKEIKMQGMILSAAGKFVPPTSGPEKEYFDSAVQMLPALQKLEAFSLNIPFAKEDQTIFFRMIFKDDQAAAEVLAAANMGLGMVAKEEPELVKAIVRKAEKNAFILSFNSKPLYDSFKAAQEKAQKRAKRISSVSNLKQIGLGCKMYSVDHSERFPDSLTLLVTGNYLIDFKVYVSPLDKVAKPATGKEIRPENTSYAYVGKGLTENTDPDIPLAFEKPSCIGEKGECAVLYVDGSVRTITVRGKTCKAIAEELVAKASGATAKDKAAIIANAAAVDQGK